MTFLNLKQLFKSISPALLITAFVILTSMQTLMPAVAWATPLFASMVIFYWSIYWPYAIPRVFIFCIGLLQDILLGTPIGITSIAYLLLREITQSQRKLLFNQPFWLIWAVFIVVGFILTVFFWLTTSIYMQQILPMRELLIQWTLSIICYPFLHRLCRLLHVKDRNRQKDWL